MTKVNAWGVICVIACSFCVILVVVFYYKNISRKILKRSLQEPKNVVVLLIATLNFLVDTLRPYDSFSWVNGLMYFFVITGFILIDMTKKKSRAFVLLLGILMLSLTCFNIYGNTIGSNNYGVVLFEYSLGDIKYKVMKRSIKRTIFVQILLLTLSGLSTMLHDKKMQLLMFATSNVYRETGTVSRYVRNEAFAASLQMERYEEDNAVDDVSSVASTV